MNRPSWRETILTNPDEQYYSLMRQISRNQIFMLRSHLCVRMNNYYIHDNPYYKRYNSMYIYQIISLDRINIFHQKILLLVELKKFVIACLVYFHVHFSQLRSQLFMSILANSGGYILLCLVVYIQLWSMCEHGIKHEVGLTTCSVPPCTMRGLLWDTVGARGILCLLRLILSSSCNAVGDILFALTWDFHANFMWLRSIYRK